MNANHLNYSSNAPLFQPIDFENVNQQDERFIGGFLGPFILGGITGGLVAPFFNNNYGYNPPPPYYTNNYYYPPYYYGPNYYY